MDERQAILDILDVIDNNQSEFQIISSLYQINQLYSKLRSKNTSANLQEALPTSIAFCETHAGNTIKSNPVYKSLADELLAKSNIRDQDDANHIVIACIRDVDYFITTDSELYRDKVDDIKTALIPILNQMSRIQGIEILNPIPFPSVMRRGFS